MITDLQVAERPARPYMGIRTSAAMADLPTVIPQLLGEVRGWLSAQGVTPAGPPLIRYLVIDMAAELQIALGWPVANPLPGSGRVEAAELPAGRYASLLYTGDYRGLMAANGHLLEWGAAQGLQWDSQPGDHGDIFGARYEVYIHDPGDEPDPAKWETEVGIRLAGPAQP